MLNKYTLFFALFLVTSNSFAARFSPALSRAIRQGDVALVATLVGGMTTDEVNEPNPDSKTSHLHLAAVIGSHPITAILLEAGARPNAVDANGRTPLYHALTGRDRIIPKDSSAISSTASAIIHAGGKLSRVENNEAQNLRELLENALRTENFEIARALGNGVKTTMFAKQLEAELDSFHWRDYPAHNTDRWQREYQQKRDLAMKSLSRLIALGADLDALDGSGWSALMRAARVGYGPYTLLENNPNEGLNFDGWCQQENDRLYAPIVKLFLEAGATPHQRINLNVGGNKFWPVAKKEDTVYGHTKRYGFREVLRVFDQFGVR